MPLIMKKTINGQPVKIRLTDGILYAGLPIGFILPSFENETPLGFLKMTDTLANRTVSRTEYKELFDWATARGLIGTGKPFGIGDGSTTFVIPDGKEIAFKGIGEYEGTVGNHVKSGGLANGEFLDDRIQWESSNRVHIVSSTSSQNTNNHTTNGEVNKYMSMTANLNNIRKGDTTEVKSLGCHYYIKAKNVGVPADFVSAIDDVIGEKLSYSTTEINTGKKWIDGKPIYEKTVDCGALPNATSKSIDHNIVNLDKIIVVMGRSSDGTYFIPLPYISATSMANNVSINATNTQIVIGTGSDRRAYAATYVTLEYTKTTD